MNEGVIVAVIIALLSFLIKNAVDVIASLKMLKYKETEYKMMTEIELIKKDIGYIKEELRRMRNDV